MSLDQARPGEQNREALDWLRLLWRQIEAELTRSTGRAPLGRGSTDAG